MLPAALAVMAGCEKIGETFPYEDTGLPLLEITTTDGKGIREKSAWKDASLTLSTGEERLTGPVPVQVKGRGNSSWTFPKKPFNIRFDAPTSFLGMPAARKWCVLANWRDATLMRNAVALETARMTSLDWTPEGRFVDVVMDGTWEGNFYVTEKVDAEHLNLYPGGFLVCVDVYYDESYRFLTPHRKLPVNILLPEDCALDKAGVAEIRQVFSAVENALYKGDGDWTQWLDAESFCDWFLVHELTTNDEPGKPLSVYMHRYPGGKIMAGPAWDFDVHTFRSGISGWVNANAVWFDALLKDSRFQQELKSRWSILKPDLVREIPAFIDDTDAQIRQSAEINRAMWPIYRRTNGDETLSYADAVQKLRASFLERIQTLDTLIQAL